MIMNRDELYRTIYRCGVKLSRGCPQNVYYDNEFIISFDEWDDALEIIYEKKTVFMTFMGKIKVHSEGDWIDKLKKLENS